MTRKELFNAVLDSYISGQFDLTLFYCMRLNNAMSIEVHTALDIFEGKESDNGFIKDMYQKYYGLHFITNNRRLNDMDKMKTYLFSWEINDNPDETQFCAKTDDEAIELFEDFCAEERIDPKEVEIDIVYDEDDAAEYGDKYITYEEYLNLP